ncbi:hypothetical protein [Sorangium sp. So ce1153]|uniref:hypothetical protein n=1 Tax=Sorangium sp. So ce1153 TaxID=3133333 RepID=UPI003F5E2642
MADTWHQTVDEAKAQAELSLGYTLLIGLKLVKSDVLGHRSALLGASDSHEQRPELHSMLCGQGLNLA